MGVVFSQVCLCLFVTLFICFWRHTGRVSSVTGLIYFLAGWCKRRPEPGYSFRFSFAYVSSF